MPVHPENLIRDAQHSLLQWSKYVGTLDAPAETAKRRLGMCMEALERWAFFYPEYRSSFVTLWNQGKPATGSAEITASYFGEGRVRGKYRLERDALSIQGHRGPAPTVGETSHDQILDPGEASRRVMSLRPILAEKFEGHYESTPAERAAIRGTVLAAIWTSRATSDPQMRNAIAEQLRLLRTLCDEEAKNLAKRKRWRLLMFLSPVVLGLATLATHLSVLAITGSSRSAQHASEALLGAAVVLFFAAIFTRKKFERAIASARLAQSISVELLAFADGSQPLTPASRPDD